jgi:hypothetical protein
MQEASRSHPKIMKMKMFGILDKAKPSTDNIKGLNLAAVICTIVQISRVPLQHELLVTSRA